MIVAMTPATMIATKGSTMVVMTRVPSDESNHSKKSFHHCMGGTIRGQSRIAARLSRVGETLIRARAAPAV
ncbi:hypothetical protein GCM10010979_12610 [Conyzicola nivalis]|uniref:Uncharacterized protein n=1 Tax=Conyzicola nivalis TaxID=1477021 RepID=A0A916SHH9_9MICO|nr:hypothetical protein GCM10010979_12610 [Conyzicola nivalis]